MNILKSLVKVSMGIANVTVSFTQQNVQNEKSEIVMTKAKLESFLKTIADGKRKKWLNKDKLYLKIIT